MRFSLSESFLEKYHTQRPDWGPLGEFVYYRTYSRQIGNRNEMWWETVKRVVEGCFTVQKRHCKELRLHWKEDKAQRSAQIMFEKIFSMKFLPPGRGLWMMGTDYVDERGSMALNNCSFVSTEDIETRLTLPFTFLMDCLMCGVGVGFDTAGSGRIKIREPQKTILEFQIPDSREGWVESVDLVLQSFFQGKKTPKFDYSLIRPYGSPIRGFGGVASGPAPLAALHDTLAKYLGDRVGMQLDSVGITDIMNLIGVCVVAGNVRRSAEIALGSSTDLNFMSMKDSDLYPDQLRKWRWASNNSVFAEVDKTDYSQIVRTIAKNGEPGIVWLENIKEFGRMKDGPDSRDSLARGVNPCGEQTLESYELCNLVETFPARHDSYQEYQTTLKYAYLFAKTVTLIPTHWPEANQVLLKNRRIGTSQSGIVDAFARFGRREILRWCDTGYAYLRHLDQVYSDWLCIPRSIKITTVKPSGTVSLLPGVSPGIHYPHSEFYIRRVRVGEDSPLLPILRDAGYAIEPSMYGDSSATVKTMVVSFPVWEKNFDRRKEDVSVWEQVKNAVDYQRYWSDNNVSNTVTFKKEEAKDLPRILESFEHDLKAISFLPLNGHGYVQAPLEEISSESYHAIVAGLKIPDFSVLSKDAEGVRFCDGDVCVL